MAISRDLSTRYEASLNEDVEAIVARNKQRLLSACQIQEGKCVSRVSPSGVISN